MKSNMYFGNACQSVALPSLVHAKVGGPPPPSADLKPLLPFGLLPGFAEMDRLQKAVIGRGFGVATPLRRRPSSCGVCRRKFNSESQASSHYGGTKHAKKLKTLDAPDCKSKNNDAVAKETTPQPPCSDSDGTSRVVMSPPSVIVMSPPSVSQSPASGCCPAETPADPSASPDLHPEGEREGEGEGEREGEEEGKETEDEKALRQLYCSLCKVAVNSASQLQAHNSGTKHKTMLEARNGDGAIKSFPRSGVKAKMAAPAEASTGLQNKTFRCETCDVHVNSETQLKQHISSRRHKDRAAGKPAKPKFSPYPAPQRTPAVQAVRLSLREDLDRLVKPLSSCVLRRHLSAAALAAVSMVTLSPFHLCPPASAPSPAPLFQAPPLSLRPAPGPLRSAHAAVLFSPY